MKAVIALVLALALLAIGIPLSHSISDGEEHTITRTIDPVKPGAESQARSTEEPAQHLAESTATAPSKTPVQQATANR